MEKYTLPVIFKTSFRILSLDRVAMDEISKDEKAFLPAIFLVVVGGLAYFLMLALGVYEYLHWDLSKKEKDELFQLLLPMPLMIIILFFGYAGFIFLISRLLGGKRNFKSYYTVLGFGSTPLWILPLPKLGWLLAIWFLPVSMIVTRRILCLGLTRLKTVTILVLQFATAIVLYSFCYLVFILAGGGITGSLP